MGALELGTLLPTDMTARAAFELELVICTFVFYLAFALTSLPANSITFVLPFKSAIISHHSLD